MSIKIIIHTAIAIVIFTGAFFLGEKTETPEWLIAVLYVGAGAYWVRYLWLNMFSKKAKETRTAARNLKE